jgi:hypothetical protein
MSLEDIARRVTDEVVKPVGLVKGWRYVHPEDGVIEITGGYYRDPTYGRISNFWDWIVVATGERKNGYGDNWPLAEEESS